MCERTTAIHTALGAFYHASEGRVAVSYRNVEAQPGIEKNMKSLKFSYTVHSAVFSAVTPISRSKDDTRSEDARGEAVTHADILAALAAAIKRPEWHVQGCEAELLESTLREEYRIELNDLDNKPTRTMLLKKAKRLKTTHEKLARAAADAAKRKSPAAATKAAAVSLFNDTVIGYREPAQQEDPQLTLPQDDVAEEHIDTADDGGLSMVSFVVNGL